MPILSLKLTELGPFDEVSFEFDPQANVFVGPNNCGKSTALFALASVCVAKFKTPMRLVRSTKSRLATEIGLGGGRRAMGESLVQEMGNFIAWETSEEKLGFNWSDLGYTSFVPALRWSTSFRSSGPAMRSLHGDGADRKRIQRHGLLDSSGAGRSPGTLPPGDRASLVVDSEIVQDIVEMDYRSHLQDRPEMRLILDRIATLASTITEGFSLKFAGIKEDKRGFYPAFETPDGRLPLDVLSQGTQSLIQWLARLSIGYARHYDFPKNLDDKPGILIIDEIDAHLHPSWQRRIIPALTEAFPALQVFCSTHSPLMLAGLKAGQIHLLRRDAKGKVVVSRNETDIVGWTADEIITSFLGVDSATDMHTEETLKRLEELRAKQRLSTGERQELERLRATVNQSLLSGPAAADIEATAKRLKEAMKELPLPKAPVKTHHAKSAARQRPVRRQPPKRSKR